MECEEWGAAVPVTGSMNATLGDINIPGFTGFIFFVAWMFEGANVH